MKTRRKRSWKKGREKVKKTSNENDKPVCCPYCTTCSFTLPFISVPMLRGNWEILLSFNSLVYLKLYILHWLPLKLYIGVTMELVFVAMLCIEIEKQFADFVLNSILCESHIVQCWMYKNVRECTIMYKNIQECTYMHNFVSTWSSTLQRE